MGLRKGLGNGLGFNQPRIVKGYEPFHRPWMVFLHITPRRGKSGFCYIHNRVGQNHKNIDLKSNQNHLQSDKITISFWIRSTWKMWGKYH